MKTRIKVIGKMNKRALNSASKLANKMVKKIIKMHDKDGYGEIKLYLDDDYAMVDVHMTYTQCYPSEPQIVITMESM